MLRQILSIFAIVLQICFSLTAKAISDTISLAGEWQYRLLGVPTFIPAEGSINLPSTLDEAHKSVYNKETDNTTQLRREFSFSGEATYSKKITIPESWQNKNIQLLMERTKPSQLRVDGREIGTNSRISSPQRYALNEILTPGTHRIEIIVNNADSLPPIVSRSSHAASESTQTNWNGILGEFMLIAKDKFHIKNVKISDNIQRSGFEALVVFSEKAPSPFTLLISVNGKELKYEIPEERQNYLCFIPLSDVKSEWSAYHPDLIDLQFYLVDDSNIITDSYQLITGLRELKADGNLFTLNGKPIFLRGTVNAAIFPQTGYAPTNEDRWLEYFYTIKDYGLNHVRFHSWTPPEAAFSAADKTGVYIQTELPLWGEFDKEMPFTERFMRDELVGIMEEYSHHPSFLMFSLGNELWGDMNLMQEFIDEAREINPRILATHGSNVYLGMNGALEGDDFLLAAKTSEDIGNSIRGSVSFADSSTGGYFNSTIPNSESNYNAATEKISQPIIAHEVGQYQSYPDFDDINFYTGTLKPDNYIEFQKRAEEAGTLRKNKEFSKASGEWAAILYKAEMEKLQRSDGISGYQLFGLQDYPGQGTSFVGILNPNMQSKGFITPEEWKESCNDLLIIAEFPKFTFSSGEKIDIPLFSINYTENPDTLNNINWTTDFQSGDIIFSSGQGKIDAGEISLQMPEVKYPQKMQLLLSGNNNEVENRYNFWVYPRETNPVKDVTVTDNLDDALKLLNKGGNVIFCPTATLTADATINPLFITDFWNYRMYRTICDEMGFTPSPGTLGLYVDNTHPALSKFPTERHTDWQWFSIVSNSYPLIIDRLPKEFDPIVEAIDNVERNFRTALLLECNVGKGKLMIFPANIEKIISFPEGKWFLQSLMEYMASKNCKPKITLTPDQIVNLVTKPSFRRKIKELKNETYNSHW